MAFRIVERFVSATGSAPAKSRNGMNFAKNGPPMERSHTFSFTSDAATRALRRTG